MKKLLLSLAAIAMIGFVSCDPKDPIDPQNPSGEYVILKGDITSNMTLTADKKYKLEGFVYVKDGAVLTVEPGTVIVGDKASKATLVITRTGKIEANGTQAKPIVFTSALPAGARDAGDWGGIVLLGKAPINVTGGEAKIEGGLTPTGTGSEKDYIWYGGSDAAHSSGSLQYVRIEFAGVALSADNELNSLTMGGVGNGTKISHIQVYRAGDDAFEWFGGTVNCDHLVATYTLDDDFDSDFGYSGNVQFGLIQRHKNLADISGSNGFESDNDGNGSNSTPLTSAKFSNITVVGPYQGTSTSANPSYQHSAQIRRNSNISIYNSVFMGFPIGLYIDNSKGTPTVNNVTAGTLQYKNNIIAASPTPLKTSTPWTLPEMEVWFTANSNNIFASTDDVNLSDPFKFPSSLSSSQIGRPDFRPKSGSPALSGYDFTGLPSFFKAVDYRGAFNSTNDWTADWTNFDADNTNY